MNPIIDRLSAALSGRYRLEREIGAGGMATVFVAEDERHHRRVAIKVLHPELSAALGTARFLKEIELTASLQHPHILPLFDSGTADGLVFYVMPFVEGESLRDRLDRERQLPVADAARIARAVAAALEYAHKRGVVHRDIKPENVLLHEGSPLVADFGIALAVQEAGGQRMTQTGLSLGTPRYMAPEQAMGETTVDGRADVWALGVMTYEMLAGEAPFDGPTSQAIVAKVLSATPTPLTELRKSVPPHVAAAVGVALEKLPADRHVSAEAFSTALGDATARALPAAGATTAPRAGVARALPWVAGVGIGAMLGFGAFAMRSGDTTATAPATTRFLLTSSDSVNVETVCCGQMLELSPDGRTLVFQGRPRTADSADALEFVLYARDLDDLATRPIAGTTGARSISFSPDGRQLAFMVGQRLMRVPVAGGSPSEVAVLPRGYVSGTTWISQDRLVVAVASSLYEVTVNDPSPRVLLAAEPSGLQTGGPSYVEEGKAVLFAYASYESSPAVHWLPLGADAPKRLLAGATPRYVPAWRKLLVVRNGQLLAYPFDPVAGDTTGPGIRIMDDVVRRSPVLLFAEYSVARDGTLAIARRKGGSTLGDVSMLTNGVLTSISFPAKEVLFDHPRFSPDGTRFVLDAKDLDESWSLYSWDLARGVPQRLQGGPRPAKASWTAAGDSLVVFSSDGFAVRSADGAGGTRALRMPGNLVEVRDFSVHGPWIAIEGLQKAEAASSDILIFNSDSGGSVRPMAGTDADETEPAISPDGRWIAYSSNETGTFEVYVSPFPNPTAKYAVSIGGGREPVWGRDGRTLYYASTQTVFYAQPFTPGQPPTFGAPRELYRRASVRTWTVSPDGSRLLFIDSIRLFELTGIEVVLNLDPGG